ncbi:MAG: SGNH/GDSL hydrolase family protein, partial [Actinomycetota bacterium]|nr:SGNH/GDSL hydrolase family protein [Actinomycetota bacterium]
VDKGGNRCHRSQAAYAPLLVLGKPLTLDFRACSGAVIDDVLVRDQRKDPLVAKQVPGPLGEDVTLVTLSIGGNDLGFADLLGHCARPWRLKCFESDKPFKDGLSPAEWVERELARMPERLKSVYEGVRAAAPTARILVLGYPFLFPEGNLALNDPSCIAARGLWNKGERQAVRNYEARLNETVATATAGVAEYVDTAAAFIGHEPCGKDRDWVEPGRVKGGKVFEGSFHPNATGQEAFARLVACHLFVRPAVVGVEPPAPSPDLAEDVFDDAVEECLAAAA